MIEVAGSAIGAPDRAWLVERLRAAAALIDATFAELRVRVVDDREMSRLHERSLGDATTTDVLTWSSDGADGAEIDVAVCADEAQRRAAELGHSFRDELLLYAVHGLLHGVGHDDATPEAFRRMHAEEGRILLALGARARVTAEPESAAGGEAKASSGGDRSGGGNRPGGGDRSGGGDGRGP